MPLHIRATPSHTPLSFPLPICAFLRLSITQRIPSYPSFSTAKPSLLFPSLRCFSQAIFAFPKRSLLRRGESIHSRSWSQQSEPMPCRSKLCLCEVMLFLSPAIHFAAFPRLFNATPLPTHRPTGRGSVWLFLCVDRLPSSSHIKSNALHGSLCRCFALLSRRLAHLCLSVACRSKLCLCLRAQHFYALANR